MEIGIHGLEEGPEAAAIYRELGVTWTKHPGSLEGEGVSELGPLFDRADELGIRCVIDLRTSKDYLLAQSMEAQVALSAAGQLEIAPDGCSEQDQRDIIIRNSAKAHRVGYQELYARAEATVARYKDRCQDWEFWGEAACPWVSGNVFGDRSQTYPYLLENIYAACKRGDPDCRVWTAGNGMDLQLAFYHACLDQGAGQFFDVANLHPYFMKIRVRENADRVLDGEYTLLREALAEKGRNQPFAATEWGYPTHNVDSVPAEEYLKSNVVSEGVRQLYWSEAEEWFEKDLAAMQRHGFEVVIVHHLRDFGEVTPYWGERCGLIDMQGRKKNVWDVVQRWAWAGRDGKKAFAQEETDHAKVSGTS